MESVDISIIVYGATGVGKSTLIHRFVGESYNHKRNGNLREITVGKSLAIYLSIFFISRLSSYLFVTALYCFHAEQCDKLSFCEGVNFKYMTQFASSC